MPGQEKMTQTSSWVRTGSSSKNKADSVSGMDRGKAVSSRRVTSTRVACLDRVFFWLFFCRFSQLESCVELGKVFEAMFAVEKASCKPRRSRPPLARKPSAMESCCDVNSLLVARRVSWECSPHVCKIKVPGGCMSWALKM